MKINQSMFLMTLVWLLLGGTLTAQNQSDPAMQKVREETAVVQDLGRMFGYLNSMEKDAKVPALSADQLKKLYEIMAEIDKTARLEPKQAQDLLVEIEDKILSPTQLMAVDKLAVAKLAERTTVPGSGTGTGNGAKNTEESGGTSSLSSYVNGGDYNPIVDKTKVMGQDFYAFFQYVAKKIGR